MVCHNPGCMGNYDFDHIAYFARKRFVEGRDTISLLQQAASQQEKEEIVMVSMLDVDEDTVRDLKLSCRYAGECKVTNCRDKLRQMITNELAGRKPLLN